jgi:phosphate-selective porin OprO/OprP
VGTGRSHERASICAFALAGLWVAITPASAPAAVEDLEVGGRLMWDYAVWGTVDEALGVSQENGTEIRRAWLTLKGDLNERMGFVLSWDFAAGEDVAVRDAYLEMTELPAGTSLRLGQFKEPFCLNQLTSSKYTTFLERASLDAFSPAFDNGVMAQGRAAGGRVLWQAGGFLRTDDFGTDVGNDNYAAGARLAMLPLGEEKSGRLIHIGAAVNYLVPRDGEFSVSQRPEVHLSERFVDTGTIKNTDTVTRLGAEFAAVLGPLHVTGEYVTASLAKSGATIPDVAEEDEVYLTADAHLAGFYAQAGYFLTGEHRIFKGGQWDRTAPARPFLEDGGLGAWEIAARYSSLDLNDQSSGVRGGRMDDVTVGLNWYLHANAKIMTDYVISKVKDVNGAEGRAAALTARVQVDF